MTAFEKRFIETNSEIRNYTIPSLRKAISCLCKPFFAYPLAPSQKKQVVTISSGGQLVLSYEHLLF